MPDRATWLKIAGLVGAGILGGVVGALAARSSPGRGAARRRPQPGVGDVDDARDDWWRSRRSPGRTLCYRTKVDALQAFRDTNRRVIDEWGGLDALARPSDFDAINRRYGFEKKPVRTLSQALWHAMPPHPPFCLDRIDLETLNETAPGQRGPGFVLPDWAYEEIARREESRYYRDLPTPADDDGEVPF